MNQRILFNDDISWDETHGCVSQTAQASGALIQCFITLEYLTRLGLVDLTPSAAIELSQMCQFDIEEDAAQLIEQEQLNSRNQLFLS